MVKAVDVGEGGPFSGFEGEPGSAVQRCLVPYLVQAIEALERGTSARDIDAAMTLGCGHPLGPLALADVMGLDVVLAMAEARANELRDRRREAPALLRHLVVAEHLGKKSGRGFYDYRGAEPQENAEVRAAVRSWSELAATGE